MELERISASIFQAGKQHSIRYNRVTHYMECGCPEATLNGKCSFMEEARKILEAEGNKVVFKRVAKLPFDEEREKFKKSVKRVLAG